MKSSEDIIEAMLDSLAYELIAAYRDYFPKMILPIFWIILKTYNQVVSDQEEEEDQKDGN